MTCICSEHGCDKVLGRNNKSGLCKPHNMARRNADPEFQARRIAAAKAGAAATRGMPHRSRASKIGAQKRLAQPGYREYLQQHMARIRPLQWADPALVEKRIAKMRVSISDARLPWCPRDYRPMYLEIRRKGLDVKSARAIVEDEIARDKAKAAAANDTFEAKLARVASGEAKLVANINRHTHLCPKAAA